MAKKKEERVWKGNPRLEQWLVPVTDIIPNPENARKHTAKDIDATAASLADHGQQEPVIVRPDNKMLMAGEGRWLAAQKLGWTHISALASDINDEGERKLFEIRDNRTAELSSWQLEILSNQLQFLTEHYDIPATGLWEEFELEPLLNFKADEKSSGGGGGGGGSSGDGVTPTEFGPPLFLTLDQRRTVDRAIEALRNREDDQEISEGRAIELVCGDFLAGA